MMPHSSDDLQFDSALPADASAPTGPACGECGEAISVYYYETAGHTVCRRCKMNYEAANGAGGGTSGSRLAGAVVLGGLGAIAGAAIYLGVAYFTGYEVGLIAILVGFIVGKAVFVGSGKRGGRRYQVLATVLTYFAISVSYVPAMVMQMVDEGEQASAKAGAATAAAGASPSADAGPDTMSLLATIGAPADVPSGGTSAAPSAVPDEAVTGVDQASALTPGVTAAGIGALIGIAGVMLAIAPIRVVISDFPGSLISVVIIGIGLMQAWQGAGRQTLEFKGPFKLAGAPSSRPDAEPESV
jgi:hypothetical protein